MTEKKQQIFHTSEVNSFLDLKAEFLRRKQEAVAPKRFADNVVNQTRKNILAVSKPEKEAQRVAAEARRSRIRQNEDLLRKEEEQRLKRQQILEEKAEIYDRLSKGERLEYEDGVQADFLVNFQLKKRELEERRDAQFGCGRIDACVPSTSASSGMTRERGHLSEDEDDDRKKSSPQKPTPIEVHYDHTEERGRVFGASHIPLIADTEAERLQKIEEIKQLSVQTESNRAKRKREVAAKRAADRARLNRIRARKGLPLLEASSDEEDEEEIKRRKAVEAAQQTEENLDDIPLPSDSADGSGNDKSDESKKPEEKRHYGVREWDRGKAGYQRWIGKQREVRDEDFRPPSFYYDS